jgi:hypothetical protein
MIFYCLQEEAFGKSLNMVHELVSNRPTLHYGGYRSAKLIVAEKRQAGIIDVSSSKVYVM